MPLANKMLGTEESKFIGYAQTKNYFEVKLTGGNTLTAFTGTNQNFISTSSINIYWNPYGVTSLTNTGYQFSQNSIANPGVERSGYAGPNIGTKDDFDFRWKFNEMNIPNGLGDGTFALQVGIFTAARINAETGGGFWIQIDSPISAINKRRIQVKYNRDQVNPDTVVYSKTEATVGEFGPSSTVIPNGMITGKVLQNVRIARYGNKFLAEWNTWADNTSSNQGSDDFTSYCKYYKNSIEFYPLSGYNSNTKNTADMFDTGIVPNSFSRFSTALLTISGGSLFSMFNLTRFDSVPAICIDTTCDFHGVNLLSYSSDTAKFMTRELNEGFSNLRISQLKSGTMEKNQVGGDIILSNRKEINTGHTTQYVFDNKLNTPKTNDLKRDVYIDSVYKFPNNQGNIFPNIYTDKGSALTDRTYSININKTGIIENIEKFDNTDFNPVNFAPGSVNVKKPSKSYFGKSVLPTYIFNDSTNNIGRDAKFSFLDNILLTASGGETPQLDQYKVFERDTTSMYLIETISDGTYFILYSRIFNQYTKTLSARVRVNSDITIYAGNPTHSFAGTGGYFFSYRYYKPNASIMAFPNKTVCALTVDADVGKVVDAHPSGLAFRIFIESEDNGASWFYRAKDSKNYGKAGEEYFAGQSFTFKIKNNDNYFFNFTTNLGIVRTYYHRVDNFAMRPGQFNTLDLMKYSNFADQTAFYISATYDPIQENIAVCLGMQSNGILEVIRSPRLRRGALKGFNLAYQNNQWRSVYSSKPFTDGKLGNICSTFDKDGDLIVLANKKDDDTSFAILRTSYAKDELDVMGRFIQSCENASNHVGRRITNSYIDNNGDIIMSSISDISGFGNPILVNIAKYGMHTNQPFELDMDEGFIYPQLPHAATTNLIYDTTTNGGLASASVSTPITGSTITTIARPLSISNKGFKSEWRSFNEGLVGDTTGTDNCIYMGFRCYGNSLTSTTSELHYFKIGWYAGHVFVRDNGDAVVGYLMDTQLLDPTKLRRYMAVVERTSDSSVAGFLFTENLELSNHDNIIWDKKLSWVAPLKTVTGFSDVCFLNVVSGRRSHINYWLLQRNNAPRHPQRKEKLRYFSELSHYRDVTNFEEWNGIPASLDTTVKLGDGIKVAWSGADGMVGDKFNFTMDSYSKPAFLVDKQPFKSWRSVDDQTTNVVVFDATDQGFAFLRSDVAIFRNSNFRRCFVEGNTSSLLNAATTPAYSKEVFFDLDSGNVFEDATNYGNSTVIPCNNKSWRPEEHNNRFVQFESCRMDGTPFRHMAFRIIDNAPGSLTIFTGPQRFDTTQGYRYVIYDGNQSVNLTDCTALYNFWRIRIPENQTRNAATPTDETAQGSVYRENCRELGEFDLGKITELIDEIDEDIETSIQTDTRETEFDNLSTVSFEFSRKRIIKKITYTAVNPESISKIKQMFVDLKGSYKTFWIFDDQKYSPRSFMLARITNEPEIEEVTNNKQSISIELEEVV